MYAPQIRHFASLGDRFEGCRDVTDGTIAKVDELLAFLRRYEPDGPRNNYHTIWIRAERGPIDAFGNYEELRQFGEVESREEFEC